jgi:hypothetical protein
MPAPEVWGFSGSLPTAISTALVRPSPSVSPSGATTFRVLAVVEIELELPTEFVANNVKLPRVAAATVRFKVAVDPSGLMLAELMTTGGLLRAGAKLKVEPMRLTPETVKFGTLVVVELLTRKLGLTDRTAGIGIKVKFVPEAVVTPLTVTAIGPVDAVAGTVTTIVFAVAETTLAAVPLKVTAFEDGVVLKFWPVRVTVVPTPPD